jgi:hypothetical protein
MDEFSYLSTRSERYHKSLIVFGSALFVLYILLFYTRMRRFTNSPSEPLQGFNHFRAPKANLFAVSGG